MQVIALLPMKEHSERVPDKNMRPFSGRPLFHWVMLSLLKSRYVRKVVIDTDSDRIARDASSNFERVQIIDRPASIQGDEVIMNTIIAYDITQLNGEHFLQTHSTNPLLTTSSIDRAIASYFDNLPEYDSLFSVTPWQKRFYWPDGRPVNHDSQKLMMTQQLAPVYEENSCLYIFSRTSFGQSRSGRIGLKPAMFAIDKLEAMDIDDEREFEIAARIHQSGYPEEVRHR